MITMLEWLQGQRSDVVWVKGPDASGIYFWDKSLPNQEQIQQLILDYNPSFQLTVEQQKQKQREKDFARFKKRAAAKDEIIAEMAAGNMERVRSGVWTTEQLITLTQDPEIKQILDAVNTLSFEIAFSCVDDIQNSLLTTDIKNSWKNLLSDNFFL